jgi:hypothetical protein
MALEQAKTLFTDLKFTRPAEPCTEDQIQALEKQLGIKVPNIYREFLQWMGKNRAGLLVGTKWLIEDVPGLKPELVKLIATNKSPAALPDDAFVFWGTQGYEFHFMRLSEGDASKIYRYHGTLDMKEAAFPVISQNLNDWLAERIQAHVKKLKGFGQKW